MDVPVLKVTLNVFYSNLAGKVMAENLGFILKNSIILFTLEIFLTVQYYKLIAITMFK